MTTLTGTRLIVGITGLTLAGLAQADCPADMPTQLLDDCIVVEASGSSFPNPTYAYKADYEAWLAQRVQQTQPAAGKAVATK